MAIVSAPILEQAGFVLGVSPPTPEPTTRSAPGLNGVDQWIQTQLITLSGDYELGFTIKPLTPQVGFNGIAYDSTGTTSAFIRFRNSDGFIQFNGFSGTDIRVNAIPSTGVEDYRLVLKRVGTSLTLTVNDTIEYTGTTGLTDVTLNTWGTNGLSASNIRIYDIYANDKTQHDYPCDDGFDNSPTIRNRGGAGDGLIANATISTWQEINL